MSTNTQQSGHVEQEGIILNESLRSAERTSDVIVCRSIDKERDEAIGKDISKYNLNYVFEPVDVRDKLFQSTLKDIVDPSALPRKVDMKVGWGSIFDQGDLGSCVSNTVAGCIRFVRKRDGLSVYDPSRLYNYYYGRLLEDFPVTEDTGMYIRSGYKAVAHHSICSERNWPYIVRRFSTEPTSYAKSAASQHKRFQYMAIPHDLTLIKKCLADGYPVSFGFAIYTSFMTATVARTGIVPTPDTSRERILGGHAMTIVGYDDDTQRFIVANSWGSDWGDEGFCYFPYDFMMNNDLTGDFWTARVFQ